MSRQTNWLTFADWLYHTFHLAGDQSTCGDCKVCVWYARGSRKHA
jgi:hypothetical protein